MSEVCGRDGRQPCSWVRELIPEIANGVAAGDERACALKHLSGCADCRAALTATAEVADELLQLAPPREPPPGFESRVLARLVPPRRAAHRPRRLRPRPAVLRAAAWVTALAAAAVIAAGVVWVNTSDDRAVAGDYRRTLAIAHGKDFSAAPLTPLGGTEIATIFAYEGSPSWLYTTFRRAPEPGRYRAYMTTRDGRRYELVTLVVDPSKYLGWGDTIKVRIRDIRVIEFFRSGDLVMAARFPEKK